MNSNLPLGEKLKQIRRAQGLSQDNVAYAVDNHTSIISRIENGHIDSPSPDLLDAIRIFLGVQNAPLLPYEIELFNSRIQMWEALLDANRLDDAKAMQPELAQILSLPFEHDLILKYKMLEVRFFFKQEKFAAAEENFIQAEPLLPYASSDTQILYYSNKAFLYQTKGDYKTSYKYYQETLKLFGDKPPLARILEATAYICCFLGKYHHGIRYIQHARVLYEGDQTNPRGYHLDENLALCYAAVGETKKAEALLDMSYRQAILNGNEIQQGITLLNISIIASRRGEYDKALEQHDKVLELFTKNMSIIVAHDKSLYVMAVFSKAALQAKLSMDNSDTIALGRPLAEGNETLTIMLDAAHHLSNLGNTDSEKYLENIAIPHLMQFRPNDKSLHLELCRKLEAHYKKKKSKTKAAYMAAIIRDIYEEMFMSEEDEE